MSVCVCTVHVFLYVSRRQRHPQQCIHFWENASYLHLVHSTLLTHINYYISLQNGCQHPGELTREDRISFTEQEREALSKINIAMDELKTMRAKFNNNTNISRSTSSSSKKTKKRNEHVATTHMYINNFGIWKLPDKETPNSLSLLEVFGSMLLQIAETESDEEWKTEGERVCCLQCNRYRKHDEVAMHMYVSDCTVRTSNV